MSKKATPRAPLSWSFPVEFKPMEGMGGGFRTGWVSAEYKGKKFGLESGAGLGNPFLTFFVESGGKTKYYTADMGDLLRRLHSQIVMGDK